MCRTTLITLGSACLFMMWGVSPIQATDIPLIDGDGHDSGWAVESTHAALDLLPGNIIDVDLSARTVTITVVKDFGPYTELLPGVIDFPFGALNFKEIDVNADKIDRIIIQSETIANNTGLAWDSFSWYVEPSGAAEFNASESASWATTPWFSSWSFETAHKLVASNGSVANGATFAPGGNLVIDIYPDSSDSPLAITLKQHVSPEPATVAVLVVGGILIVSRRLRRR